MEGLFGCHAVQFVGLPQAFIMYIFRKLEKVQGNRITIELPESFYAKEVEVLVIPYHKMVPPDESTEWKKDFRSISQWDITEDDIKILSWPIQEF